MEQGREAKALEQVAEWAAAKAGGTEAVVVPGKAEAAAEPDRAEIASAPIAVKKRPTRWERPATTSSVPSVGHPWHGNRAGLKHFFKRLQKN